MIFRLATRGSALALAQAHLVQSRLHALFPHLQVDILPFKTTGDKMAESPLSQIPGKGIFIKEIEEALMDKRADIAVHSLKDLPTDQPQGLRVAAVLEREDPRDCLISRFGEQLRELPRGSVIGTSSLRRQAQIRAVKKNVRLAEMRGNLDTRLRKVMEGDVTCIVVALAGVKRLGRQEEVSEVLSYDVMLPAPGQGCIGVECRSDDGETAEILARLNHEPSFRAATAERAMLAALGGGCRVPIAAYAREEKGELVLDGLVISPDGASAARERLRGSPGESAKIGAELGRRLLEKGGREILQVVSVEDGLGA